MEEIRKGLLWYIFFRLIIVTSLAISAIIIQFSTSTFLPLNAFYFLIVAAYFLSLIYIILYFWNKHYIFQAYLQILMDVILITALVYISGGIKGTFYILYIFAIIAASMVVSKRAAYLAAALSAISFGVLVDGMVLGAIPYFGPEKPTDISLGLAINSIVVAWAVFFLVAVLINYLTEKIRRAQTELKSASKELELKKRLALAGEVFAQVAHEIRNPLAAISGSVQVLKKEVDLNEEQKNLMDIVVKESQRVSHSLDQFLSLTTAREETFSWINLPQVLKDTLMLLQRSGELDDKFKIEGNYTRARIRYFGNENQFKQVFWNLTRNAIKAMPNGGRLKFDFFIPNKKELHIKFTDTGKGMSEEEKENLFRPFYSGFTSGEGIGLSIVRRIVDDCNGSIQVNSELYKGTEILIVLPRQEAS